MAEAPKKAAAKAAADTETKPVELSDAAASTDPAVHQLLAHRQTAALNGDAEAADAATAELAKLGFR